MIFTEEEVNTILENPKNLANQFERDSNLIIKEKVVNKNNGGKRLSLEEKILVGTMARAGMGTNDAIASEFGINTDLVTNLKQGRENFPSHPYFKENPILQDKITKTLNDVQEKAIDLMLRSIGVISDEKLAKVSAKDASTIAANASKIAQNCAPQVMNDNRIQVVMYAPKQKELDDFKVVEL